VKSIIVSDLHIGEFSHGFVDSESGYNTRLLDVYKRFNRLIKYCVKNGIKNIIIPGDVYDLKTPKNLIREIFATIVTKTISNKLKLYVLLGNHDYSSSSGHALSEMEQLSLLIDGLTIISEPKKIDIDGVDFIFHPFNPFNTKEDNEAELIELAKQKTKKSVLIGHFSTDKNLAIDEKSLDYNILKSLNFDIVFLGHIHENIQLDEHIWHVGSFTRTSFNEEVECKSVVEFDHRNFTYEFIEFDDRKFKTFVYQNDIEKFENEILSTDLSELVTRIDVSIDENDIANDKIDELTTYVKENSWNFCGIVKDIKRDINTFTMTERTTPVDAFKTYCDENKDIIGSEFFKECIKQGLLLLEEGRK
jgi:DNA repair exonuclease SbcCD nuclease subunit